MTEPIVHEVVYDEDGIRIGRYPWWFLAQEGDRLLLKGQFTDLERRRIQIAASRYAATHGLRLATRNASVSGPQGYQAVLVFHQGRKEALAP